MTSLVLEMLHVRYVSKPGVVAHAFSPSNGEAETRRPLSLKPAMATVTWVVSQVNPA